MALRPEQIEEGTDSEEEPNTYKARAGQEKKAFLPEV
jgi:hypothetical protein